MSDGDMEERFAQFSSFYRLKRIVARILRLKGRLLRRPVSTGPLTVDERCTKQNDCYFCFSEAGFSKGLQKT